MNIPVVDIRLDERPGDLAALGLDTCDQKPIQGRRRATLVAVNMGFPFNDELVARSGLSRQGQLVAHGPARNEKGRFLAKKAGHLILKLVDGGIVPEHVVPNCRSHHGFQHARGWPGDGVAPHIDDAIRTRHE